MNYSRQIQLLQERICLLTTQLGDVTLSPERKQELIISRSQCDTEMRRLQRLQWEEDTQRVDLDDRY